MRAFVAALSTHPEPAVAAGEILGELTENLSAMPDVAVVFASGKRVDSLPEMVDAVHSLLMPHTLIAVSAGGTVGGAEQIEQGDSFSVWAGSVGEVQPVRLTTTVASVTGLPETIAPGSILLLVTDPFSFHPEVLIELLEASYPGVALAGGVSSTVGQSRESRLWLDDCEYASGAVGLILPPGVAAPVVSQGDLALAIASTITAGDSSPTSALVFTGNSRAQNMFNEPDQVAQIFSEFVEGSVSGMFCSNQFGRFVGQNAVHSQTVSALLFGADSFGS